MSSNKGKAQMTDDEMKERDLKRLTNNVTQLFKSVHNITNYITEKEDNELSNSEVKAIFDALRPTIKYINQTSKVKSSSKGGKKSKVARDPNMPKKPPSPYFLFCGKMRPVVSKRDSSLHPQQVVTELGKLWKELTEEQKNQYKAEAEKLKAEYDIKMKEYLNKPKEEKIEISDYSSSSSSSSEEDEVESEEDSSSSSDDEKKDKKVISKKHKAKTTNDKKKKRKLNDSENMKKAKPGDDKKKLKKPAANNKKVLVKTIKKAKPQPKPEYPDESSSDSSTSSSESDSE